MSGEGSIDNGAAAILKYPESMFYLAVEQSPVSIVSHRPDGRTEFINHACRRLWGLTDDDVLEKLLRDYNIFKDEEVIKRGFMPQIRAAFAGEVITKSSYFIR